MAAFETVLTGANLTQALLFLLGILPPLLWSLLKEKRFVKRSNMFLYGVLAIIFGATENYSPMADANIRAFLPLFLIVGVLFILVAFNTRHSRNFILGYKSIAAFEIPVMLYMYGVVVMQWNLVFWTGAVLFVAFNVFSYMTRRESDQAFHEF
jgi:hypothetical protein